FQGDGVYVYSNFGNYVQDVFGVNGGAHYSSFSQTIDPITGVGKDDFWSKNSAYFAEDSWKALPKLTVSVGIRYDLQLIPQPTVPFLNSPNTQISPLGTAYTTSIPINHHMLAPRIGFAYNPFPGTVVRGGYGLFFGNVPLSTYYNVRVENGKYQGQYNLAAGQNGAPTNTKVLFVPPGPALAAPFAGAVAPSAIGLPTCVANSTTCAAISFHGMDPHFTNPYTHSFDLAIEQQVTSSTSFTLAYTGTRGMRLPYAPDRNVTPWTGLTRTYDVTNASGATIKQVTVPYYPSASSTAGVGTGTPLPSPNDGNISVITSSLNTWYHALSGTVNQRLKYGFSALANFTWAHTLDGGQIAGSGGTFYGTDIILDPYNRRNAYPANSGINMSRETSNSDIDMRTRFVGSLVYNSKVDSGMFLVRTALTGWTLAGSLTAQDGFPITAFMSNNPSACSACGNPALAPRDGGATGGGDNTSNAPGSSFGRNPADKRNGFKGPGVHNMDVRISRDFNIEHGMRIQILAEAFNLANHRNGLGVATLAYSFVNPSTATTNAGLACPTSLHANSCIIPYQSNNTGTSSATLTTTTPFGTINSTSGSLFGPRQLQFAAKLFF
ncbi:MAG: TonB-dependent receptor, partial [Acidobacteriota bacterium]|nr:TonB-dependent receptor [Acidobacteriota bacterium]